MQKMFVIHYYINKQILDSYLEAKMEKTCSKKISVHVMIAFWITQICFQNLTQERDLKY
jgi:hypothetical protein